MAPKKCCKCFSLLSGSKIIAIVYFVGSALGIKGLTVMLTNFDKTILVLLGLPANMSLHLNDTNLIATSMELKRDTYGIDKVLIVGITFFVLYFLFCLVLIVGIFKKVPSLITPWVFIDLIRQLIFLAFSSYGVWIISSLFVDINFKIASNTLIVVLVLVGISTLIIMGMSFYFWLVVKTAWKEMDVGKNKIIAIVPTVGTVAVSVINTEGVGDNYEGEIKSSKPPCAATLRPIDRAFIRLKMVNKLR